ncbi:PAS domain S-box protein [Thalassobaculum sp. OXR-137]|uniref:ATP-binding protein n=1 Tax=Thalassobaculum sp. OXR-137 TaxID=3100173 RepID=UPI002AC8C521|nr:ATP-binding protein [Thalassobaculum sp. OXR-137]WPZ35894.1 PAS domain S-box protein [Thalassobaculum sp. OXR-137]
MKRTWWTPRTLVVTACIAATAVFAWHAVDKLDLATARERLGVSREVGVIRARLEHALTARLEVVNALAALVALEPDLSPDQFATFARAVTARVANLRSVQLARDAVVSDVYPLAGNEAALGHDLRADPARRAAVEETIRSRSLLLAGPVSLRQGGTAVIGRLPVFVGPAADRFWGLAVVLIDLEPLLAEAGIVDAGIGGAGMVGARGGLDIALRGRDGTGDAGAVFYGSPTIIEDAPVTAPIQFNGGSWQILARPAGGWASLGSDAEMQRSLALEGALLLALIAALVALLRRLEAEPGRLRRAVKDTRRQLQTALDTITEAFAYYDAEDRLVTFNRQYRDFYQESAPAIAEGARFEDVIRYGAAHGQYDLTGRSLEEVVAERLDRHRNPQGTMLQKLGNGRWVQISERRTPDGGIAGIRTDVTDLKEAEDKLRAINETLEERVRERVAELDRVNADLRAEVESNKLLAAVVTAIPNGVTISDARAADNPLIYCNPAFTQITGYTFEEIRGRNCRLLAGEDADPEARRALREGIQAGRQTRVELLNRRKDGTAFWNELAVVPVRNGAGELTHFVGIQRDVTRRREEIRERERMQCQLMESGKFEALGTLAGGIAHEINTPVQYLSDNLGFLKVSFEEMGPVLEACRAVLEAEADAARGEALAALRERFEAVDYDFLMEEIPAAAAQSIDGAERIAQIVRAIREFSHPSDRQESEVDLNAIVETAVTVTRNQWKYQAEVEMDLSREAPIILGNAGELTQVVVNLLVNAAQSIEEQGRSSLGRITIASRRHGSGVELEIGDDGPGIPEEIRSKIFEPFFTTKEPGRGTGQGLAISDAIVRKHGGRMTVRSTIGEGTVFTLTFDPAPTAQGKRAAQGEQIYG